MTGQSLNIHAQLPALRNHRTTGFPPGGRPVDLENTDSLENTDLIKKKRGGFAPPSAKDVREYASQSMLDVDPESFVNYYESKGWMVGKNKMVSWQAAVRGWAKRQPSFSKRTEQPVNGVPRNHQQWEQWMRDNGHGQGPMGLSPDETDRWAQRRYKEKNT